MIRHFGVRKMEHVDPAVVHRLRELAQDGRPVPELLREVARRLSPQVLHPLTLAKYMREAFGLSLLEVKPIGGWSWEGRGELSDDQLNDLVMPSIVAHRDRWSNRRSLST